MTDAGAERAGRFGAALAALEGELDWAALGAAYCEGDARGFFDAERRERLWEVGLRLFDEVAAALPEGGPGRSLYLGAGVAELAPLLAESVVLGRTVHWHVLAGLEADELDRALGAVGERLGLALPRPSLAPPESVRAEGCDHVWLVSVLSDPDAFPALHDVLYERVGSELATGRGDLERERRRAGELVDTLLERTASSAVWTTTDEELELVRPRVGARGWSLEVPRASCLSALVGDAVRVCRLSRSQTQV